METSYLDAFLFMPRYELTMYRKSNVSLSLNLVILMAIRLSLG